MSFHDVAGVLGYFPLGTSDLDGAEWVTAGKDVELPATSKALLQQVGTSKFSVRLLILLCKWWSISKKVHLIRPRH